MVKVVVITESAQKDLADVPEHVATKLQAWAGAVAVHGLEEVRKVRGYHDEPLQGKRQGQRSIRLSRAYRAIYVVVKGAVELAEVREVNKHRY